MTTELPLTTRHDAYGSFRTLPRQRSGNDRTVRTVFLSFDWRHDRNNYDVRAHGPVFPADDNGEFMGCMNLSPADVEGAVNSLRRSWQELVVEALVPGTRKTYHYAGLPVEEFGDEAAREKLDGVALKLAREGDKVRKYLFGSGDQGLERIGKHLDEALRREPQTVTVRSDDLFVPWSMLYLPPDDEPPHVPLSRWRPEGFLGYRHLIEHTLKTVEGYDPLITHPAGRLRSALHFDMRIQETAGCDLFDNVRTTVEGPCDRTTVRTTKDETAAALCDPDVDDQILVFGAHGHGGRTDERGTEEARLVLGDDDPIKASDLDHWGRERGERLRNPLCYMMVCEGGQVTARLHEGLGRSLFTLGVGCLVGPQIDLPMRFADAYSSLFLDRFLRPGSRVADVARDLTRFFLDRQATPLGLVFTHLRGIDNRLVPLAPSDAELN